VGVLKSGMRVSLDERVGQVTLRGQADPVLLYLAVGGALGLGVLASILRSPMQGVVSSFIFSALFSPLLIFLIYTTLRLRSYCVISKGEAQVFVNERSYGGYERFAIPIADLTGIVIVARSQLPIVGGPESYTLYLETDALRYMVLVGHEEAGVHRIAERLSEVLRLPVQNVGFDDPSNTVRLPGRVLAATAVIYLVPPLVAIAAILLWFKDAPVPERLMITSIGAIVLSQLGAILAFGYFRSQQRREH
jgi:hypothetical protein